MALANDNRKWRGNQPDAAFSTGEHTLKPIPQPPCSLDSQKQFEDITDYVTVTRDKWGAEMTQEWSNHSDSTPGMGMPGDRQFASNKADLQSTGYGNNLGLNVIEYGEGAAFNRASTVYVAVDRSDRGKAE